VRLDVPGMRVSGKRGTHRYKEAASTTMGSLRPLGARRRSSSWLIVCSFHLYSQQAVHVHWQGVARPVLAHSCSSTPQGPSSRHLFREYLALMQAPAAAAPTGVGTQSTSRTVFFNSIMIELSPLTLVPQLPLVEIGSSNTTVIIGKKVIIAEGFEQS
jgi:hypothetical protein